MTSSGCSMPTEMRIIPSVMPSRSLVVGHVGVRHRRRVLASDSVPPRLTASFTTCSAFSTRNASASPP
jgi:hypothetical protein